MRQVGCKDCKRSSEEKDSVAGRKVNRIGVEEKVAHFFTTRNLLLPAFCSRELAGWACLLVQGQVKHGNESYLPHKLVAA